MSSLDIREILSEIEDLLASAGDLPPEAELAVEKLLNVVEALSSDKQSLVDEVQRLKLQLDQKKKAKTTGKDGDPKPNSDHSSEKHRRKCQVKKPLSAQDRHTFKDLTIHETIKCPVDPKELPPDAVRLEDEEVIVQDIKIKPRNIRFQRSVYYSSAQEKYFRGALPSGKRSVNSVPKLRAILIEVNHSLYSRNEHNDQSKQIPRVPLAWPTETAVLKRLEHRGVLPPELDYTNQLLCLAA